MGKKELRAWAFGGDPPSILDLKLAPPSKPSPKAVPPPNPGPIGKRRGRRPMAKVKRQPGELCYCKNCSMVDVTLSLGIGPTSKDYHTKEPVECLTEPVHRSCSRCEATKTPLWRKGPMGYKTLCNACGLRYWKEKKRLSTKLTLGSPIPKKSKK